MIRLITGTFLLLVTYQQIESEHQFGTLFYSHKQYDILEFVVRKEHKFIITSEQKELLVLGSDNLLEKHFRNTLPGSFDLPSYGLREHATGLSYAPILHSDKYNLSFYYADTGYEKRKMKLTSRAPKTSIVRWHRTIANAKGIFQLVEYEPQRKNDYRHFVMIHHGPVKTHTIFSTRDIASHSKLLTIAAGDYKLDFTVTRDLVVSLDSRTGIFQTFHLSTKQVKSHPIAQLAKETGFEVVRIPLTQIHKIRFHYDSDTDMIYISADVNAKGRQKGTLLLKMSNEGPSVIPYKPEQALFPPVRVMDIEKETMYFLNLDEFGSRSIFKYSFGQQ